MGRRRMESYENRKDLVEDSFEVFESMMYAGEKFNEALSTAKQMLPTGCVELLEDKVFGNCMEW